MGGSVGDALASVDTAVRRNVPGGWGGQLITPSGGSGAPVQGGSDSANTLANIALSQYNQTQPLRTGLINQYSSILNGQPGSSSAFTGAYAPLSDSINSQYNNARSQITEGSDSRGGGLSQNLANASLARAQDITGAQGNIIQNAVSNSQNLATGLGAQSISGLGAASGLQQNAQNSQFYQQQQKGQGIGSLINAGVNLGSK